jgi:hypothetical protein
MAVTHAAPFSGKGVHYNLSGQDRTTSISVRKKEALSGCSGERGEVLPVVLSL